MPGWAADHAALTRRQPANKVVGLGLSARLGGAMDLPADPSRPAAVLRPQPAPAGAVRRARRRRPTGEPPPLPHHLQTSGVRWLVAAARAGRADDRGLRPRAARPCRGRDRRRRRGGPMAWRAAGSRAGGDLAGAGGPQLLVGPQRTAVGAAAGAAGAAALPAPDRPGDPCPGAELGRREPGGGDRPAAAAVRGRDPGGLGRLGACRRYRSPTSRRRWWWSCTRWCRRAAGATPASGWWRRWWR